LHLHQRVGEWTESHAAIFLRDEGTPEALLARLLAQLAEDRLVVAAVEQLLLRRLALLVHPFAHSLTDRFCLRRNFKIEHVSLLCDCVCLKRSGKRGSAATRSVGTGGKLFGCLQSAGP